MDLVIDANIFISALISTNGRTFDLIFNDDIRLFAPVFLLEEIKEHEDEILAKSGLLKADFDLFLSLVSSRISFISKEEFIPFLNKAEKFTPYIDDMEYFALALRLDCAIWSNDKELKKQETVKIYSTSELLKLF